MNYIEESEIFNATRNGLDVFIHYYPDAEEHYLRKKHFKDRADEKSASAFLFKGYEDRIFLKDFGSGDKAKHAIAYVMEREGLMYLDALHFIQNVVIKKDLGGKYQKPVYKAKYSKREPDADEKRGDYKAVYFKEIPERVLRTLGRYVEPKTCEKFNLKAVKKYELVGYDKKAKKAIVHIFEATDDYPIIEYNYGEFKKIYKPLEPNKKYRFFYVGDKPANYIYGLKQIQEAKHELLDEEGDTFQAEPHVREIVRVSGETDALNLASLGFHVYWLNSETAELNQADFNEIDEMAERHYQVLDLDATGMKAAQAFGLRHLDVRTISLPKSLGKKKDFRGNACKDVRDFVEHVGKEREATYGAFKNLMRDAYTLRFWDKEEKRNKKGEITGVDLKINLENLYRFLSANGYYTIKTELTKQGYAYVNVQGRLVEYIDIDAIKRHTKGFLKRFINQEDFYMRTNRLSTRSTLLNKINVSNQINEQNLQDLPLLDISFKNHNRHYETLIFQNAAVRITKDRIEQIKHQDLENFVIREANYSNGKSFNQITPHNFYILPPEKLPVLVEPTKEYAELVEKLNSAKDEKTRDRVNTAIGAIPYIERFTLKIQDSKHIFIQFLRDLSRLHWRKEDEQGLKLSEKEQKEEQLNFVNLMFIMGYIAAQHKDPAKPKLVLLQDALVSQVGASSGRSGKSLLITLLEQLRISFYIGARRRKSVDNNDFIYDGLTKYHDFINVDDLHEYADFDQFYTEITGKRVVNGKFHNPFTLSYADSGKMIVSSNFPLRNTDTSTLARILPGQVSDYYHEATKYNDYKETRSPRSKFGRNLYDDFTQEEWNIVLNFIAYCIQLQQRFDMVMPPMGNIEKRQLRLSMAKGLNSKDEEFLNWADDYFHYGDDGIQATINELHEKQELFENFLNTLTFKQRKEYKVTTFKRALIAYTEYKSLVYNPMRLCDKTSEEQAIKRRIRQKKSGQTKEYICLASSEFAEPITDEDKNNGLEFFTDRITDIELIENNPTTLIEHTNLYNQQFKTEISADRLKLILQEVKPEIKMPF